MQDKSSDTIDAPDEGVLRTLAEGEAPDPSAGQLDGLGGPVSSRADVQASYRDLIAGLAAPVFSIFAPGWRVQLAEVDMMAEAWAAVMVKYWPDGLDDLPEVLALTATAAVLTPRLVGRVSPRPQEHQPAADGEDEGVADGA